MVCFGWEYGCHLCRVASLSVAMDDVLSLLEFGSRKNESDVIITKRRNDPIKQVDSKWQFLVVVVGNSQASHSFVTVNV